MKNLTLANKALLICFAITTCALAYQSYKLHITNDQLDSSNKLNKEFYNALILERDTNRDLYNKVDAYREAERKINSFSIADYRRIDMIKDTSDLSRAKSRMKTAELDCVWQGEDREDFDRIGYVEVITKVNLTCYKFDNYDIEDYYTK